MTDLKMRSPELPVSRSKLDTTWQMLVPGTQTFALTQGMFGVAPLLHRAPLIERGMVFDPVVAAVGSVPGPATK